MSCTSSCKTQDHKTYGECLRAQSQRIGYCGIGGGDASVQKRWDRDIDAFKSAVKQGIHPKTSQRPDVDAAVRASNETGSAYRAW